MTGVRRGSDSVPAALRPVVLVVVGAASVIGFTGPFVAHAITSEPSQTESEIEVLLLRPDSGSAAPSARSASPTTPGVSPVDAPERLGDAGGGRWSSDRAAGSATCIDQPVTADALQAAFGNGAADLDGVVGADYQRTLELPDGRVLWTFQDVYLVPPGDDAAAPSLIHNGGLVQDGMCFEALHGGGDEDPASWIGADETDRFERWFWPLDGYVLDDRTAILFLAEMVEPGDRYLSNATPVATWSVPVDLETFEVGELSPAPNPGDSLYGFSVATDDDWLYLYAQCHRQFGFSELGPDECGAEVFLARQPLGRAEQPLEYWSGDGWSRNSRSAVSVAPHTGPDGEIRHLNPMQVERVGEGWIAVTDVDDWWRDEIYVDVAPAPQGPWTTVDVIVPERGAGTDEVASYFASVIPTDDEALVIAVGNNRWDGVYSANYRPHFISTAVPRPGRI